MVPSPAPAGPSGAFTITDPATVATIATVVDGMRPRPDGT
jgi:hypothetical protein